MDEGVTDRQDGQIIFHYDSDSRGRNGLISGKYVMYCSWWKWMRKTSMSTKMSSWTPHLLSSHWWFCRDGTEKLPILYYYTHGTHLQVLVIIVSGWRTRLTQSNHIDKNHLKPWSHIAYNRSATSLRPLFRAIAWRLLEGCKEVADWSPTGCRSRRKVARTIWSQGVLLAASETSLRPNWLHLRNSRHPISN